LNAFASWGSVMPYQTFWYLDHKIAYLELIGDFSIEEMIESSKKVRDDFLDDSVKPTHLICDLRGLRGHPQRVKPILEASKIYLKHPAMGWVIFIGLENPVVSFLVTVITQITRTNFKAVSTLREAQDTLIHVDPDLNDDSFNGDRETHV